MNRIYIDILLLCLVFVGALNWGLVVFNQNLVKTIDKAVNKALSTNLPIENGVYLLVAVSAGYLLVNRSEWLSSSIEQLLHPTQ